MQAFIVVGGKDDGDNSISSVETLLPGATNWTSLTNASLPLAWAAAQASIIGGRLRVNGGYGVSSYRSQVMMVQCTLPLVPILHI